ncbi:MAG: hypothetical protein CSA11_08390 [Chloroflexi bacterium]|nr:MAG: hypothetical protein CSA11_08390 [Chloroflexota bacterium]
MQVYEVYTGENQQDVPVLGVVSLWFGAALVGITAVARVVSYQSGGTIGATAVAETFRIILFALILASFVYLAWQVGRGSLFVAAMPLLINIFTLIIIQFVPFAVIWEEMSFQANSNRYHKVVDWVESNRFQINPDGSLALPFAYRGLSQGGQVWVENQGDVTSVFFVSLRQSDNRMEGFIYRSDGQVPRDDFGGNWRYVAEKRPFWFYCAKY